MLHRSINMFSPLQFVFFTGGIVFLTLIVNGSTTQFILHLLDMDKLSSAKVRIPDVFVIFHVTSIITFSWNAQFIVLGSECSLSHNCM